MALTLGSLFDGSGGLRCLACFMLWRESRNVSEMTEVTNELL